MIYIGQTRIATQPVQYGVYAFACPGYGAVNAFVGQQQSSSHLMGCHDLMQGVT
jgi:hypothetical protein